MSKTLVAPTNLSTGHPIWDASGNVGVGTLTPNVALTVVGSISATGSIVAGIVNSGSNFNLQSGTSYVIQPTDNGIVIGTTTSSSFSALPSNSLTYPAGFQVGVLQLGTGRISLFTASSGIPGNANGAYKTRAQYSIGSIMYTGSATGWVAFGDLAS